MGLIWLRQPVLWHSNRTASYSATSLAKMTNHEKFLLTSKFRFWYEADWDYAQPTVIFFCAAIFATALLTAFGHLRGTSKTTTTAGPTVADRLTAFIRYLTSRQFRYRPADWYAVPLAQVLGVSGICVFVMTFMLSVRPYYWPNSLMGHSPPIATRSGWISIAIMPFMIAFSTKINFIGLLTNTSHEKLQVYHRWTAFFMYITSLVHTFPFIVDSIRRGDMMVQYATSPWYWTGVAALVPQTYLIAMSWGPIRNRYYETFKKLHFVASGIFMAALFIHVNFRLSSWDYFWATAALYTLAWLIRVLRTLYTTGLGLSATVESIGPSLVKISIPIHGRFSWTPGQHVFVRVFGLGVHALTSHPFTVSSLRKAEEKKNVVELVMRARGGLTGALARRVEGKAGWATRVVLDGPYGGLKAPAALDKYERVVFLAGGTGTTFTLPIFTDLVETIQRNKSPTRVQFVVAVANADDFAWCEPHISAAATKLGDSVDIRVHFTRAGNTTEAKDTDSTEEAIIGELAAPVVYRRPVLPELVQEAYMRASSVAIIACGPDGFLYDVRNAVATCQLDITDGFGTCKDLFLHTETYSW
ncbi:Ferric-chelate reductase [Mycena kentingensis (nom. inval.)]|nr:Ferric-chelate reductase [Mycena kentingensis (nom. inval.)]